VVLKRLFAIIPVHKWLGILWELCPTYSFERPAG
jgi:hypothetical protein